MKILKNNSLHIEGLKYLFIGGLSTIFSFIVFTICLYGFKIHYVVSFLIAGILSILLTYTLNFIWVFKPEDKFQLKKRFINYFWTNFLAFLVNLFILHYIVSKTGYDPLYVQMVIMIPIVTINFLVAKFWSMKKAVS